MPTLRRLQSLSFGTLLVVSGLVCFAASGAPDDTSAFDTVAGKGYVYKISGGQPQNLEVYFPPGFDAAKPVPGLLFFHGGGWVNGDTRQFRHTCAYFASRGLVAITADYRMLPKGESKDANGLSRKSICITDAKSALRWVKQHATELGIDPKRIVIGGGSAGGHLAIMAVTNPDLNDPHDPAGIDTSVVACLLFNPALTVGENDAHEDDALRYASGSMPPSILFFGADDTWKKSADAWYEKTKKLGAKNIEFWVAPNEKHGFFNHKPWSEVTLREADCFLVSHGLLEGKATIGPLAGGDKLVKEP